MTRMSNIALCASLLMLTPVSVFAQQSPDASAPEQTQDEEATYQGLIEQGFRLYLNKQYADAIIAWRKALVIRQDASLYYNIARAYEKQDLLDSSLQAALEARKVTAIPLTPKVKEKNDRLVKKLRAEIARRKAAKRQYTTARMSWTGYSGIGMAVVGSGVLTYAGFMMGDLNTLRTQGQSASEQANEDRYRQLKDEHGTKQNITQGLVYGGSALVVLGLAALTYDLFTIERYPIKAKKSVKPAVSMGIDPFSQQLIVRGQF